MGMVLDVVPNHMAVGHSVEPVVDRRAGAWRELALCQLLSTSTGIRSIPT